MNKRQIRVVFFWAVLAASLALPVQADDAGQPSEKKISEALGAQPYSPYADRKFPTRPLFGDTHLHTGLSLDAGIFGARLRPRDAYRFARGERVKASRGEPAQLARPLDFLVVTDHSCLLYTSPSPRDGLLSRMPSSA